MVGAFEGTADGPDPGTVAAAGGALSGAWGSLIALGVVAILGLGDDFIGQNAQTLFVEGFEPETPETIAHLSGTPYNVNISVNSDNDGRYDLYFFVRVDKIPHIFTPNPPPDGADG